MSRSIWKGSFLLNKFFKLGLKKKKLIWAKNTIITSELKGQTVYVYNGKEFKTLYISNAKIGLKFGQFIFTRKYTQKYKLKNKKIK